jgi:hypothetical protein
MNINEILKATGHLKIERKNSIGELVELIEVPNLVVAVGKTFIASRMVGTTAAVMSHMAIGSDQTAAASGNTTLGTELGRVALTSSTASSNSVTFVATFPAGTGTGDVKEAGIFNATPAGTLLCRTTFPIVTKQSGDSISITWVVTVN